MNPDHSEIHMTDDDRQRLKGKISYPYRDQYENTWWSRARATPIFWLWVAVGFLLLSQLVSTVSAVILSYAHKQTVERVERLEKR